MERRILTGKTSKVNVEDKEKLRALLDGIGAREADEMMEKTPEEFFEIGEAINMLLSGQANKENGVRIEGSYGEDDCPHCKKKD